MNLRTSIWSNARSALGVILEWPLRRSGYEVRKLHPLRDFRDRTDDPIEALHLNGSDPFLIDVPLSELRGLESLGFPLVPGAGHPLIDTVVQILRDESLEYGDSPLYRFYDRWRPRNAAETLGLDPEGASPVLTGLPPYAGFAPWYSQHPLRFVKVRLRTLREDNQAYGKDLGAEHGTVLNGPLSVEKGRLELDRLREITKSIRHRGYLLPDSAQDHIPGHLMIRDSTWRVMIRNGNHRASVLAALGWSKVPILIASSVGGHPRRAEAGSWPNVRRGVFTEEEAQSVFDRIFDGRQPHGCPSVMP